MSETEVCYNIYDLTHQMHQKVLMDVTCQEVLTLQLVRKEIHTRKFSAHACHLRNVQM